jgi:hypothetical protein
MIWQCPECNPGGGGGVDRAKVAATGGIIYCCDECDALWLCADDIGTARKSATDLYARAHSLTPDITFFDWVEADWEDLE